VVGMGEEGRGYAWTVQDAGSVRGWSANGKGNGSGTESCGHGTEGVMCFEVQYAYDGWASRPWYVYAAYVAWTL
jgi:hypothetical protein